MKALGAEVIRTPTEAAHDSPDSNLGRAESLLKEIPNAVMLNQYDNPNSMSSCPSGSPHTSESPLKGSPKLAVSSTEHFLLAPDPDAHYYTTAPEIIASLAQTTQSPSTSARPSSGLCDALVAGAGTGGTVSGLSKRLQESNPEVFVIGVDPRGSVLARPKELNKLKEGESDQYKIEGIGYDFVRLPFSICDSAILKSNLVLLFRSQAFSPTLSSTTGSRQPTLPPSPPLVDLFVPKESCAEEAVEAPYTPRLST